MIDFSVVICTYNGSSRLPEVLNSLKKQINTENIRWEILVIDNNSKDSTAKTIQEFQFQWLFPFSLKYVFEARQGLAFARQRAVEEANGQLIGFLDDDNLPISNWVASAYSFGREHPQAGAYGGKIIGDFEVNPPQDFRKLASFLALVERGEKAYIYERSQGILPPAAGLVIRKQVWCKNVPKQLFLVGRVGKSMLASEDLEAVSHIQNAGWEIWYNPDMLIYHKIPSWRLERNYLISLVRGIGLARHHIRMTRLQVWQRPIFILLYLFNDLRKVILYLIKYKGRVKSNVVVACEFEFFLSSLFSPLYLLQVENNKRTAKSPRSQEC
ncbi:MAG: hormogonium polysaccharide biosynthesis glycosyltransferase HpsE [Scytonematopsis contorta HA4267-MV1]|jgi:glycosyltransferase involved in cell wall biosynthesis|nr:hormogonium polysaccharide biosynthesis glycosyltransferase HpsE [Scytonematopsis contorta HA4267-MV1]